LLHEIFITDIRLRCVIGVRPEERLRDQPVEVSLRLTAELPDAGRRDEIDATVDYGALHDRVSALVKRSSFHLIESLAHAVAALCLEDPRVRLAEVTVVKPQALRSAARAGVTVRREAEAKEKR
jgi:D-erythro-7,8-dihydroneopterin triphosphate epimerase